MAKRRADLLLAESGLAPSRARAQALIMAGLVFADGRKIAKPGELVVCGVSLSVRGGDGYVSRGARKLIAGLDRFAFDVAERTAIDVGASTGGFTDLLLKRGALKVYAVDVGYGQLHWDLRNHGRVVVLERTNARYLTEEQIPDPVDLVVCDASFIALSKVLPAALALTAPDARLVALIKPQFEAGRADVGKGGVVRDGRVHQRVCDDVCVWLEHAGWTVHGVIESPLKGAKGNIEFLVGAAKFRPVEAVI